MRFVIIVFAALLALPLFYAGAVVGLSGGALVLWVLVGVGCCLWWLARDARQREQRRNERRLAGKSNCPFLSSRWGGMMDRWPRSAVGG